MPSRDTPTRTAETIRLVQLAMMGTPIDEIAREMRVNPQTIRTRLRRPDVKRMLAEAETEAVQRIGRQIQVAATHGLRVLLEAATSPNVPWATRVTAATRLVQFSQANLSGEQGASAIEAELDAAAESLDQKMATLRSRLIDATAREVSGPEPVPARALTG